jgi:hypothetical protein
LISSEAAHKALETTAATAGQVNMPGPGRMTIRAPRKPTTTALQRRMPTCSLNQSAAPNVTKSPVVKLSAPASASGIVASA